MKEWEKSREMNGGQTEGAAEKGPSQGVEGNQEVERSPGHATTETQLAGGVQSVELGLGLEEVGPQVNALKEGGDLAARGQSQRVD